MEIYNFLKGVIEGILTAMMLAGFVLFLLEEISFTLAGISVIITGLYWLTKIFYEEKLVKKIKKEG